MHAIEKIYQEKGSSWAVQCSCGWKEKGVSEVVVRGRFLTHKEWPHR